jgi:hypothetical protein
MTTTRIATSTQKIVAIGVPPGLLLNLLLQLCNRSYKVTSFPIRTPAKRSKAQSRRVIPRV